MLFKDYQYHLRNSLVVRIGLHLSPAETKEKLPHELKKAFYKRIGTTSKKALNRIETP